MKPIKEPFKQTYSHGLKDLIAGETTIGKIDGQKGELSYRGYSLVELTEKSCFEEVAYLLIHGKLPTQSQYKSWIKDIEMWHHTPPEATAVLSLLPEDTPALILYRTMLTIAACHMPEGENSNFDAQWRRPSRIFAWSSSLATATICHILGKELNTFNPRKSYSENFLMRSLGREFTQFEVRTFDVSMIVQAEHGFQAAALAALTTISTGADLGSAVLAGMGSLSGRMQGGSIQSAFLNILNLNSTREAKDWVNEKLSKGYRFPGFGHRIYKTHDPRTKILEPYTEKLLKDTGKELLWDIYCTIRDDVEAELGDKGIYTNVYGITGLIYHALGLPIGSYPIIFALAIQTGWMAHCLEYLAEGKIIEPGAIYTG